ncbi:MAG: RHS repeat-associated core domain-containing protein [Thermoanaerobaculia bacterium]
MPPELVEDSAPEESSSSTNLALAENSGTVALATSQKTSFYSEKGAQLHVREPSILSKGLSAGGREILAIREGAIGRLSQDGTEISTVAAAPRGLELLSACESPVSEEIWIGTSDGVWRSEGGQGELHQVLAGEEVPRVLCEPQGVWALTHTELDWMDFQGTVRGSHLLSAEDGPPIDLGVDPRDGSGLLLSRSSLVRVNHEGVSVLLRTAEPDEEYFAVAASVDPGVAPRLATRPALGSKLEAVHGGIVSRQLGPNELAVQGVARFVDDRPVAGATVKVFGDTTVQTTTASDGTFVSPGFTLTGSATALIVVSKATSAGNAVGYYTYAAAPGQTYDLGAFYLYLPCDADFASGEFPTNALNGDVRAMTLFNDGTGTALYVGGTFTTAGGVTVNRVAKWNGTSWSALGSGLGGGTTPSVDALVVFDDGTGAKLYAGGKFTTSGATSVKYVGKWTGSAWSQVGLGLASQVLALAVYNSGSGNQLYAAGSFTTANSVTYNRLAKWSGSAWQAVSSGANNTIRALASWNDGSGAKLFVGGDFTQVGGSLAVNRIAKWNGTAWSTVGTGVTGGSTIKVTSMLPWDDGSGTKLFVGGRFTTAGSVTANHVARWNGSAWSTLATGLNTEVDALGTFDDGTGPSLYALGTFTTAAGTTFNRVARWNTIAWQAAGDGFNSTALAAAAGTVGAKEPSFYSGGSFTTANGIASSHTARLRRPSTCTDYTYPELVFQQPLDGSLIASSTPTLILAFADIGTGVNTATLVIKAGTTTIPASCSFTSDTATCTPTQSLGGGPVTLTAMIQDFGGNPAQATRSFTIQDVTPPTLAFTAPGEGATVTTARPPFSLSYSDSGSGVDPTTFAFTVDGASAAFECQGTSTSGSCVPTSDLASGVRTIVASVRDYQGNTSSPATLHITVAPATPYSVSFHGTAQWQDGSPASGARVALTGNPSIWTTAATDGQFTVGALITTTLNPVEVSARLTLNGLTGVGFLTTAQPTGTGTLEIGTLTIRPACDQYVAQTPWVSSEAQLIGSVKAAIAFDDGSGPALYVGGMIDTTSQGTVHQLVRWTGAGWEDVGGGVNNDAPPSINGLTTFDDGSGEALYAGGDFTSAGGHPASNFARWNGLEWREVGHGANGPIHALASFDDGSGAALWVAGTFSAVQSSADWTGASHPVTANRIARWNGQAWVDVSAGFVDSSPTADAYSLAVLNDGTGNALFFWDAWGSSIWKWTGSVWQEIATPAVKISDLVSYDDGMGPKLYLADYNIGIMKWNGSSWTTVIPSDSQYYDLAVVDGPQGNYLYATGIFPTLPGSPSNPNAYHLRRWNGSEWSAPLWIGSVPTFVVAGLGANPVLYGVGVSSSPPRATMFAWNGSAWTPLAPSGDTYGPANSVAYLEGTGGSFKVFFTGLAQAGGVTLNGGVGIWDGQTVTSAGAGLDGGGSRVVRLWDGAAYGVYAIAGASGQIAKWNGTGWTTIGQPIGSQIGTVAWLDTGSGARLYAGGTGLYRWNGSFWAPQGGPSGIGALEVYQGAIYAGGIFTTYNSTSYNHLAKWDGASWYPVLSGGVAGVASSGHVAALRSFGGLLQVGGAFSSVGNSQKLVNFAAWNGAAWTKGQGNYCGFSGNRHLSPTVPASLVPAFVDSLEVFDDGKSQTLLIGGSYAAGLSSCSGTLAGTVLPYVNANLGVGGDPGYVAAFSFGFYQGAPATIVAGNFGSFDGLRSPKIAIWGTTPNWPGCSPAGQAPVITVTSPPKNATNQASIAIAGHLDEPATLTVNGVPVAVNSDLTFTTANQALHTGINIFYFEAVDRKSMKGALDLRLVRDGVAPTLAIAAPTNGSVVTTGLPQIALTFTDAESGIDPATLGISINGAPLPLAACTVRSLKATCIPQAPLANGAMTVTASIRDQAGNLSSPAQVTFTVNTALGTSTTLVGNVHRPNGSAASGARVRVLGRSGAEATTAADGSFSLLVSGVLTVDPWTVTAEFGDSSNLELGVVQNVSPVLGGVTSAGVILLDLACDGAYSAGTFGSAVGLQGRVLALAVYDDGTGAALYAGGSGLMGWAMSTPSNLLKWTGNAWQSLPSGSVNGAVRALAVYNDGNGPALYVGGSFTFVGALSVKGLARWNGSSWADVGGGVTLSFYSLLTNSCLTGAGGVHALEAFDDGSGSALYVGGSFTSVGAGAGTGAEGVARWNGSSWAGLAGGSCPLSVVQVEALEAYDDGSGPHMYAAGTFASIGGIAANNIAKWTGSTWSPLGLGVGRGSMAAQVNSLVVFDGGEGPELVAGGLFTNAGDTKDTFLNVARWNGGEWKKLGAGLNITYTTLSQPSGIQTLAAFDDGSGSALYAAGSLSGGSHSQFGSLARWNGATWEPAGGGISDPSTGGMASTTFAGSLVLGGGFSQAGGFGVNGIAKWGSNGWTAFGTGLDAPVRAVTVFDDGTGPAVFAAGQFVSANGTILNHVAKWNGVSWEALGAGVNGTVSALAVHDDGSGPALYAGGSFTASGATTLANLAKWTGSSWIDVGGGVTLSFQSPGIQALASFDDGTGPALYVAGGFSSAGAVAAANIARWRSGTWSVLGSGTNALVRALTVSSVSGVPKLYVGGEFTTAGGATINRIAAWDGSSWSALGSGTNIGVYALLPWQSPSGVRLVAGGGFTNAGGVSAAHVAIWNGTAWSAAASGVDNTVEALQGWDEGANPGFLAGGAFTHSGGLSPSRFAAYWANAWRVLGPGVSGGDVLALAQLDDASGRAGYLGGGFVTAGGAPSPYVAKWARPLACTDTTGPSISIDSPMPGAVLSTNDPEIDLTYSDARSGVDSSTLELKVDAVARPSTCSAGPSSAACHLDEPLADGQRTISATVRDFDGNLSQPASITVSVDASPPMIVFENLVDGGVLQSNVPEIDLSFSDAGSGIDAPTFAFEIEAGTSNVVFNCSNDDATASCIPQSPLGEGSWRFSAHVSDFGGQVGFTGATIVVDTMAPALAVEAPLEGSATSTRPTIAISWSDEGSGLDSQSLALTLDGATLAVTCSFATGQAQCATISEIASGNHELRVTARDLIGHTSAEVVRHFSASPDSVAPSLSILQPIDASSFDPAISPIVLQWSDDLSGVNPSTLTLSANGQPLTFSCGSSSTGASCDVTTPISGSQTLTARVHDFAGNPSALATAHFTVPTSDTTPPRILVTSPQSGSAVNVSPVTIHGSVDEPSVLTVNGASVAVRSTLQFAAGPYSLAPGLNVFYLHATDAAGNASDVIVNLTLDTQAPEALNPALLFVGLPAQGFYPLIGSQGCVPISESPLRVIARNSSTGRELSSSVLTDGSFDGSADGLPGDRVDLFVADPAGNRSAPVSVTLQGSLPAPPDPDSVAPGVDPTVPTGLCASASFLWSESTRVQYGVVPESLDCDRLVVLRGRTLDLEGSPISGVRVTVVGHPEFGVGISRLDGVFDFAATGGQSLTLLYQGTGRLATERRITAGAGQYQSVPDVVLVSPDLIANEVDLATSGAHVAGGSGITDSAGTRSPALVLPSSTTASLIMPNGSSQPIEDLTIRLTELSVGSRGAEALPPLPSTMGYTYAVDLSIDEAAAAGARSVEFAQPLYFYVENFLGFPVGSRAPAAYFDSNAVKWVPSVDGRVIRILSVAGGLATIDISGTGLAASGAELSGLGFTDAERSLLASRYSVGQSLWRVPVSHFTLWTVAWPYKGQVEFLAPDAPLPISGEDRKIDKPTWTSLGGAIEVDNQILGESIPLQGTPYSLTYRSDRVPGRTGPYTLVVPITDATPDSLLQRIDVEIDVAGQHVSQSFSPGPSLSTTFTWDGNDRYGRPVQGPARWEVNLRQVFPSSYLQPPIQTPAFDSVGGVTVESVPSRQEWSVGRTSAGWLGSLQSLGSEGLGGWTISAHHTFDPKTRTLYFGSGSRRTLGGTGLEPDVLYRVAGTGNPGFNGDDGPARDAQLSAPYGLSVMHDSSLLIADRGNCRIRKVAPDGSISTVAGTVCAGLPQDQQIGDGGPATAALLSYPTKAVEAPDGTIYIADTNHARVRHIKSDGSIETVAGNGFFACDSVDVPATSASLYGPFDIAFDSQGNLLVVNYGEFEGKCRGVQRIDANGILRDVATGRPRDGYQEIFLPLSCRIVDNCFAWPIVMPEGLATRGDGTIFFTQRHSVRFIPPDGASPTNEPDWNIAGVGYFYAAGWAGDGEPASDWGTRFSFPGHLVLGGDGTIFVADSLNASIRSIDASPERIVNTVAGGGTVFSVEDGTAAKSAAFGRVRGVTIDASSDVLYFSDETLGVVWKMAKPIDGVVAAPDGTDAGEYRIPSSDGRVVYVFDLEGRHLRTFDAITRKDLVTFGYSTYANPNDPSQTIDLLTSITDAFDNVTTIARNSSGTPTSITAPFGQATNLDFAPSGYLSRVRLPLEVGEEKIEFDHGSDGLLRSIKDAKNQIYSFQYDAGGRLTRAEDPAGGSRELSFQGTELGRYVEMETAEGLSSRTTLEFRKNGDLHEIVRDASGIEVELLRKRDGSQTITYADDTEVSTSKAPDPRLGALAPFVDKSTIKTPVGHRTSTTTRSKSAAFDPNDIYHFGSEVDSVAVNGRLSTSTMSWSQKYLETRSPEGRKSRVDFNADGLVSRVSPPEVEPVSYSYDSKGRLEEIRQGPAFNLRKVTYGYDIDTGLLETVTDVEGKITTFERDKLGRVTKETLSDQREVHFTYDVNGNLTSVTPPTRPAHEFDYTPVNQVSEYTPPAVGLPTPQTTYAYNDDHQLTTITRPDSQAITFHYDSGGRLNQSILPTGTLSLAYDSTNGKLSTLTAPSGATTHYDYDGPVVTKVTSGGMAPGYIEYFLDEVTPGAYATNFWLESYRLNGEEGTRIRNEYDDDGLATKVGDLEVTRSPTTGLALGTDYLDTNDAVTRDSFGELATYRAGFDDHQCAGNPPWSGCVELLKEEVLERDHHGRIQRRRETTRDSLAATPVQHVYEYTYDADTGRLEEVERDGATWETYAYDDNGNRTSWTDPWGTATAVYDDQDRLTSTNTASYTYTANGELLTKTVGSQTVTYTYDVLGALTHVALPSGIGIDYVTDARNRRIAKKVNGTVTEAYLYGLGPAPLAKLDGSGNVVARYVYGTRSLVPDAILQGTSSYRIFTDRLGSVRTVVNAETGDVVQRLDYDAYGRVMLDTNPGFQPWGFAGGLYDYQTSLVRFGARDYDAEVGRWTAKDPVGFGGGSLGLFEYVNGDPINRRDPSGFADCDPDSSQCDHAFDLGELVKAKLLDVVDTTVDVAAAAIHDLSQGHTDETICFDSPKTGSVCATTMIGVMPVTPNEVGLVDDLLDRSPVGDLLDVHHFLQKKPGSQVIPGYDDMKTVGIALPRDVHAEIPTRSGPYAGTPDGLLTESIDNLWNAGVPPSSIELAIELTFKLYPGVFLKP